MTHSERLDILSKYGNLMIHDIPTYDCAVILTSQGMQSTYSEIGETEEQCIKVLFRRIQLAVEAQLEVGTPFHYID